MSVEIGGGRRERKREATRTAIEDVAWSLFAEKGFDRTTVEDITEQVDVAARTFFRYFPSKESVLFGDPRALEAPLREAFLARPADESAYAALRHALEALAAPVEAARDRHLLRHRILQEHGGRRIEDRFGALNEKEAMVRELMAERLGTTVEDPEPQLLAGVAVTVMDVAYRQWMASGATSDLSGLVRTAFRTLARLAVIAEPSEPGDAVGVIGDR